MGLSGEPTRVRSRTSASVSEWRALACVAKVNHLAPDKSAVGKARPGRPTPSRVLSVERAKDRDHRCQFRFPCRPLSSVYLFLESVREHRRRDTDGSLRGTDLSLVAHTRSADVRMGPARATHTAT